MSGPRAVPTAPDAGGVRERAAILAVDDDPNNLVALRACLEDLGEDLVLADSGTEALRRCLERDFAVILLDVRMPGMDGFEAASLIRGRARSAATPIIFLTGDSRSELDRLRGYSLGAVDYLLKPVDPQVLRSKVASLVDLWRRTREVIAAQERLRELEARELRRQAEEAGLAERRRGEAQVRTVLERQALIFASVPVVLFSRPGRAPHHVSWVSDNVRRITGYEPGEITGDPGFWASRLHPADREAILTRLRDLEAGQAASFAYRWRLADGSWRWLQEHARADEAVQGEIVGTWLDIHEHKLLEEALRDANAELDERVATRTAELQEMVRELESFSYTVSHDLRAPLRSIHGFSRILEEQCQTLGPEGRLALDRIEGAVVRMSHLIDDLLALSRVSRAEVAREPVDLSHIAGEVVAALRERDPERQVEVTIEPGLVTAADPRLVRVALENLIGNAWKFTRSRQPAHIRFGAEPGAPRVYYVRDDGIGFDMTYAGQLFQPFHRLHPGAEFEGTGIGLATVRRIVQRHGGEVRAEGLPDKGATFRFTLEPGTRSGRP